MARSSSILSLRKRPGVGAAQQVALPMPSGIAPMLAALSELPRDPSNWSFEYKWDGVRAISYWDGKHLRFESRNRLDITRRYPELADLGPALGKHPAILDGEILALDETGRPSFPRLQCRMHAEGADNIRRLMKEAPVWYVLFDVLWANGRSTMELPYTQRRQILQELTIAGPAWQITPAHTGHGESMLRVAKSNHLEGLVAKRLTSTYQPGRRSPDWIKIKVIFGQEFVIGGWVPEKGVHHGRVGSLLLGYYQCPAPRQAPRLRYAGKVGTGFDAATHAALTAALKKRAAVTSPFVDRIPFRDALFVAPELVAQIEFRRWPEAGLVQQASFKGLREDKNPKEIVKEGQGGLQS